MAESFIDAVLSRNIIALIILILMVIVGVRLLYNTGKSLFLLICFVALAAVLYYFFPEFVDSILARFI